MKKVISVRFKENGKSYYFDPAGADIKTGEYVIVETARGIECGEVVQGVKEIADSAVSKALKPITRMADSVDVRRMRQNREDEKRAYHTCQECIARHGLEMKLVEAEYTLDRSKIMFYFTADGRAQNLLDPESLNASARFEGDFRDMAFLVELLPDSALRRRVADAALAYLGVQYRWGGKSSLGLDCSGLAFMAWFANGVLLYRDAQIVPGFPVREIPRETMDVADLLFFPGHVALYLGGGRYPHSTARAGSSGVVINSLDPLAPDYRSDLAQSLTAVGSVFPLEE